MESLNLNNTYLKINNTAKFFPRFKYNSDNIPLGNSMLFCVSLFWASEDKGQNFDLTTQVSDFPQCEESKSGMFIWNSDDPTTGVDVPAWTQQEYDIDCTDQEDCESACLDYNALYLNGKTGKKCFSYQILKSICITVAYDSLLNQYSYKGGCYEGGAHYLMQDPVIDRFDYFEDVNFEVRNYNDPIIRAGEMSNYSYSFGTSFVSKVLLILFAISYILNLNLIVHYYF